MKKVLLLVLAVMVSMSVMADDNCLYTSTGEITPTEGWGDTPMPKVRDVKVEGYDGYVIFRAFAGVEGFDLKVEFGDGDSVIAVTPIENGEEGKRVTSGYVNVNTGREDVPKIRPYVGDGYCYGKIDAGEASGYYITNAYVGEDWSYVNFVWPQGSGEESEWDNPFEGEATFLYSAVAHTDEAEGWGARVFPTVDGIDVDVYDKYIYIHALGGVEGYDAKVAYDADENVLSIIGIADGEESAPCKSYLYLKTGREDYVRLQAYTDYSYAASYDDQSGYVCLCAYIYDADGNYDWNYYYIIWEGESSVAEVISSTDAPVYYSLDGNRLKAEPQSPGLYIKVCGKTATQVVVK